MTLLMLLLAQCPNRPSTKPLALASAKNLQRLAKLKTKCSTLLTALAFASRTSVHAMIPLSHTSTLLHAAANVT